MSKPELTIPISPEHVSMALGMGRINQAAFCDAEMTWLEAVSPFIHYHTQGVLQIYRGSGNIEKADACRAGWCLGSFAVRSSVVANGLDYEDAVRNFTQNFASRQSGDLWDTVPWDNMEKLDRIFGDPELSLAFMDISHDTARDAAATVVGFFCLAKMPKPDARVGQKDSSTKTRRQPAARWS